MSRCSELPALPGPGSGPGGLGAECLHRPASRPRPCSAGGTGVLLNVDRVAEQLQELGHPAIQVRGLVDSGWFLDNKQYHRTDCVDTATCAPTDAIRLGIRCAGRAAGLAGSRAEGGRSGVLTGRCGPGTGTGWSLSAAGASSRRARSGTASSATRSTRPCTVSAQLGARGAPRGGGPSAPPDSSLESGPRGQAQTGAGRLTHPVRLGLSWS